MTKSFSECQCLQRKLTECVALTVSQQDHSTTTVKAASFTERKQGTDFLHKAWPTKASGAVPVLRAMKRQMHIFPQAYPAGVCTCNTSAG